MAQKNDNSRIPVLQVKHEAELDHGFSRKIARLAHGEKLYGCIQCGNCSSSCPLSTYMDYTPRKIIAMVKAGFRDEVLANRTIWLCASCYACTVECPKSIKITDIMYALKREAIMKGIYPRGFPIPVLSRVFYSEVRKKGRINETWLLVNFFMKTNIFKAFGYLGLSVKLFMTGRLHFFEKKLKGREAMKRMLETTK